MDSGEQGVCSDARRRPLEGLTVIELGTSVAAPYACLVLADLGARVIKVENPGAGDHSRSWGPPFWRGTSAQFFSLNRGKESVAIDLSTDDGQAQLRSLILEQADAVVQNLRPGLLAKFGLTPETLQAEKPSLIWCDIGAFGQRGPLSSKPGYDPLAQATSGIMSVTGEPNRPPVRVGVSLVDMGSGMWTVIGLLVKLLELQRTGSGGRVETSLFETALAWMTTPMAVYHASGEVPEPQGSGAPQIVPYQAFRTADEWLMIAAGNDNLFRKLCTAIGRAELAQLPAYAMNAARVQNKDPLIAELQGTISTISAADLSAALDAVGVPNAPLLTVDKAARHPQTQALGMVGACAGDDLPLMGIPISLDGTRPRSDGLPPELGEQTEKWVGEKAL